MFFNSKGKLPHYSLHGHELEIVEEVKFLGVIIQSMYNAPKKGELFAYTSLCRPILEYADVVWDPHTRTNIRVANFQTLV